MFGKSKTLADTKEQAKEIKGTQAANRDDADVQAQKAASQRMQESGNLEINEQLDKAATLPNNQRGMTTTKMANGGDPEENLHARTQPREEQQNRGDATEKGARQIAAMTPTGIEGDGSTHGTVPRDNVGRVTEETQLIGRQSFRQTPMTAFTGALDTISQARRMAEQDPNFSKKLDSLIRESTGTLRVPHTFACEGSKNRVQDTLINMRDSLAQNFSDNSMIDVVTGAYNQALTQLAQKRPEANQALNVLINVGPDLCMVKWDTKTKRLPTSFASVEEMENYEAGQIQPQ